MIKRKALRRVTAGALFKFERVSDFVMKGTFCERGTGFFAPSVFSFALQTKKHLPLMREVSAPRSCVAAGASPALR